MGEMRIIILKGVVGRIKWKDAHEGPSLMPDT